MDLLLTQSNEEGYAELDFLVTIIPDLGRPQDEIYGPEVLIIYLYTISLLGKCLVNG
ncbi:hypothetical protein ES288_A13G049300v1 [Gossypium darwinii]|uniref:Uncharacterized protein n=1 Tax=Gossypium darwinii TaxID=34276 RepID=A0A5D2DWK9_GOSDA|nr:hypothetical protein ES288_A13G049300v1 [Gossypium darwinii]